MEQCPCCGKFFKRLSSHIHHCKGPQDHNKSSISTDTNSKERSETGEICPKCQQSFKRLASHLPHCKEIFSADLSLIHAEFQQKGASREETCPKCYRSFKRLASHSPHCKGVPKEAFSKSDTGLQRQSSNLPNSKSNPDVETCPKSNHSLKQLSSDLPRREGKHRDQKCSKCNAMFENLNSHLPHCQGTHEEEIYSRCQERIEEDRTCPVCGQYFKRLASHLPYCKMKSNEETCPKCDQSFKRLASHLRYCKGKEVEETCPRCTKTFKRLASHLPHCAEKLQVENSPESRLNSQRPISQLKEMRDTENVCESEIDVINELRELFLQELNECGTPFQWSIFSTGSYYDRTKMTKIAGDYDFILYPDVKCIAEFCTQTTTLGYCKVTVRKDEPKRAEMKKLDLIKEHDYFSPGKMKEYAFEKFERIIKDPNFRQGRRISPPTDSEEVWLKDVTTRFHTYKRTLSDHILADELTFKLMHKSHALTLNLKRNYGINPNADMYVVRNLKDGLYRLHKTQSLEKEDVAYYQDVENGAFMTVRCVKRSNGRCDRVINGNIRIGGRNYDLEPAETNVTSRNVLDVPDFLGRRYVLHDQANKDAVNAKVIDLLRRIPEGQSKRDRSPHADTMLSSRNGAGVHNSASKVKKDNVKEVYDVGMTVLIDSGIWDLFSSLVNMADPKQKEGEVKKKIRGFYSHIINGVDLRYKGIKDTSISIGVTLRQFVIFERETDFPHKESKVIIVNGVKSIDVNLYLNDILEWDIYEGGKLPDYDHAMLFTRYDMYQNDASNNGVRGLCWTGGVCKSGSRTSVVEVGDYFLTVGTATHELGHSLGAVHDGTSHATVCKSEDLFIMTENTPKFDKEKPYSRNPWIFSNCSVEAFKSTLKNRDCVKKKSVIYNETEWKKFMLKLPGEVYSVNEQCKIFVGHNSSFCGTEDGDICLFMKCKDQKTGKCLPNYFSAARGTMCGRNMWCIEGRCIAKPPK